ncbi:MAG: ATP-binding cassette domain-containing protein [Proteobacteria bacterium]|nr:ATP-binding cassette domain-containing protein [Pseudomonadota bacterium]
MLPEPADTPKHAPPATPPSRCGAQGGSTAVGGAAPAAAESLRLVLGLVLDRLGLASAGTRRIPAPQAPHEGEACVPWARRALIALASPFGLKAGQSQLSVRDALQLVDPQAPLLACGPTDNGSLRWVLITERRGRRLRATVLQEGQARSRTLSTVELASLLDLASARQATSWLTLESALPLEALGAGQERSSSTPSPLRRLRAALGLERETLWALGVYAAFAGVLALATPLTVQALVNTIAFGGLLQPLFVLTLLLLSGLVLAGGLRVLQSIVVEQLQRRVLVRTVVDLATRLPRVRLGAFERAYAPELVNRFFEVVTLQKATATLLLDGLDLSLAVVIGITILSFYHPLLVAFSVLLVAALAAVLLLGGRGTIESSIEESYAKYAIAAWLEELARLPLIFRSRRDAGAAAARADELARSYLRARGGHFRRVLRQIVGLIGLQVLFSSALLAIGGWLVLKGQLTLGQLVAAELIVTVVVASLAKFGKQLETFYDLAAAIDKLGKLIDLPLEPAFGVPAGGGSGAASAALEGVRLGGLGSTAQTLDLRIGAGERIGITGASGSGKSQLLDTLYGLRAPEEGRVIIDGVELRLVDLPELRQGLLLLRDAPVLVATLRENLQLRGGGAGDEALQGVLDRVGLGTVVRHLPEGLDTPLGAEGAPLCAGERVRLAVACALLRAPRLLLVDAVLDALDPQARASLLELLYADDAPWTLLIASQHDDVLRRCDRVLALTANVQPAAEEAT